MTGHDGELSGALSSLLARTGGLPARELHDVVVAAGALLGAESARLLVADYALVSLQELGEDGPRGESQPIEGTLAGRALERGEVVLSVEDPTEVWVPLTESGEQLGVLELVVPGWTDELRSVLEPIVRVVTLVLLSKRRYTDIVHRARRSQPLSMAAEVQWDLLPPLTCATTDVSVSGILEPAYSIGGDSFDYALNHDRLGFAVVDAVGHGLPSVLLSVAAVNSLRNSRRERAALDSAYRDADEVIESQFGQSYFVTAQFGSLELATGLLTWLNAGHPLPLLVRDGSFIGELACRPSLPLGLGGPVIEVAQEALQSGDRVLFYSDGVTETRSTDGEQFGIPRLADYLVRATLDEVPPAETVRRLSALIVGYNPAGRVDDATLMLIEYHRPTGPT